MEEMSHFTRKYVVLLRDFVNKSYLKQKEEKKND
jgi:hypothetical protein